MGPATATHQERGKNDMAVTKVPTSAALKMKLNTGTDDSGNPVAYHVVVRQSGPEAEEISRLING